jgi:hypothetical protein
VNFNEIENRSSQASVPSVEAMLTESTPQMFLQARHELDEIAGAEAVVELVGEDALPGDVCSLV